MIIFCLIWFLILYGGSYMLSPNKAVFSPIRFVAVKYALTNLLFIFYIALNPEKFSKLVLRAINVPLDEAFLKYTIVQTIAYVSLLAGMWLFKSKQPVEIVPDITESNYNFKRIKFLAIALFLAGILGYFTFITSIGGIGYLISNLHNRVHIISGNYILMLLPLTMVGCIMMLLLIRLRNKTVDKVLFFICSLMLVLVYSSFGSRKNTVIFIIIAIVAINYIVKPLRLTKKVLLGFGSLVLCLCVYILFIPLMRGDAKSGKAAFTIDKLIYQTSYTFIDVFASNYYNGQNVWLMDGYFAPMKSLYKEIPKDSVPQTDQGVYFKSIVLTNKDYRPPMPRAVVSKTSWPTENFGFAYANFLIPGVVLFFFLQGIVFAYGYRVLATDYFNPAALCFYVIMIFTFNFSSLRVAGFIKLTPVLYLGYVLFNFFGRKKSLIDSVKIKL